MRLFFRFFIFSNIETTMKIHSDKIQFKPIDDHISLIFHETDMIKFWTPEIKAPFGVDENFGKHYLRLELDPNNTQHQNLKKIIEKVESILLKKLSMDPSDFKSVIRKKIQSKDTTTNEYNPDIIDVRLKFIRNALVSTCEYENQRDHYLKTIYEIDKDSYVKVYLEIHGFWDYRSDFTTLHEENKKDRRVGLIVNALKVKVLDKKDSTRNNTQEFYIG